MYYYLRTPLPKGYGGKKKCESPCAVTSRIFNIIRDYSTSSRSTRIELKLVEAMVMRKGFTDVQLKHCLEEYQSLDLIQMNTTGTHFRFVIGRMNEYRVRKKECI